MSQFTIIIELISEWNINEKKQKKIQLQKIILRKKITKADDEITRHMPHY